eukprot:Em0577g1a
MLEQIAPNVAHANHELEVVQRSQMNLRLHIRSILKGMLESILRCICGKGLRIAVSLHSTPHLSSQAHIIEILECMGCEDYNSSVRRLLHVDVRQQVLYATNDEIDVLVGIGLKADADLKTALSIKSVVAAIGEITEAEPIDDDQVPSVSAPLLDMDMLTNISTTIRDVLVHENARGAVESKSNFATTHSPVFQLDLAPNRKPNRNPKAGGQLECNACRSTFLFYDRLRRMALTRLDEDPTRLPEMADVLLALHQCIPDEDGIAEMDCNTAYMVLTSNRSSWQKDSVKEANTPQDIRSDEPIMKPYVEIDFTAERARLKDLQVNEVSGLEKEEDCEEGMEEEHCVLVEVEDGGEEVEDGGEEVEDGGEEVEDGGEEVEDGGEEVEDGGEEVEDGGEEVEDGGEEVVEDGGEEVEDG